MARKEYVEELLLNIKVDKTELEKIQKDFEDIKAVELLSPEAKEDLEKAFKQNESRLTKLKEIEKEIAQISKLSGKAAEETLDQLLDAYDELKKELKKEDDKSAGAKYNVTKTLKDGIKKGLIDAGEKAWDTIKKFAEDTFKQAVEMMKEIAAYSDSSKVFSEEATNLKLTYGLEGSEAYALQKALQDVGLSGIDEYLEKGWMLNQEQRDYLEEQLKMYKRSYESDQEIALAFQKFEVEWSQFKKEMSVELIHFFTENKDTIKTVMSALMTFMEAGLQFFSWFASVFGTDTSRTDYAKTAATSDILNNYVTNNGGTSSRSVSINNQFNGVQTSDKTDLINAGSLTYEQVIRALE